MWLWLEYWWVFPLGRYLAVFSVGVVVACLCIAIVDHLTSKGTK